MQPPSANTKALGLPPLNRSVLLVTQAGLETLVSSRATAKAIGVKALGLLAVPAPWVPRFFVVSGNGKINQAHLEQAAKQVGIALSDVFVRSNGTQEGMEDRGTYDSDSCAVSDIGNVIKRLRTRARAQGSRKGTLHFLVQERVPIRARGHLSNERRLSQHFRDWNAEIDRHPGLKPVGVRNWRDASSASAQALLCNTTANIPRALRAAAAWLGNVRGHFEWVWDGACLWIVQLDILAPPHSAASPRSLVSISDRPAFQPDDLRLFTRATTEHGSGYRKLRNAEIYRQLGYILPDFYVMNDREAMRSLLDDGKLVQGLRHDLSRMCRFPLVIRTDASDLDTKQRQMLPRSEELRSSHAAEEWLLHKFRPAILDIGSAKNVALIAHHFVPATASAWAQAKPGERRVRIEALWGIPEGLYYFAHDVFDVDTGHADLHKVVQKKARCVSSRVRYKGKFIAPNEQGEWIIHQTDERSDWTRSIQRLGWIKEIAYTTRCIAESVGDPVTVMWLVDVPRKHSAHSVLPWYHEKWVPMPRGYTPVAPRKKFRHAEHREITSRASWEALKSDIAAGARVERLLINPDNSDIVRDRNFVEDLAQLAKQRHIVVELSGGLLSHAFYMLSKYGCDVECVDLFAIEDERLEFNKIVRDKIPTTIAEQGESVEVVSVCGDALLEALKRKLVEEALEAFDASTSEAIVEELADVREVIDGIIRTLGLSSEQLQSSKDRKKKKRGGFGKGLMLVRTRLSPSLQPQIEGSENPQMRTINVVAELPRSEAVFNSDLRRDINATPERQITITLPADGQRYRSGQHRIDVPTLSGERHEMSFETQLERQGSTLKVKVLLSNAPEQVAFDFPKASDEDSK